MLIYLDSKDLINILEKSEPLPADKFENFLKDGSHKIVLSFVTIMEIVEPLRNNKAKTNIMSLLSNIEKLPHTYIHSDISRLELQEALRAFSTKDNYKSIDPFVNRFDETCDLNASPATKCYINYSLPETVWDLYNCCALGGLNKYAAKLEQDFAADRALSPKPSLKVHFIKTIERNIKFHQMSVPCDIDISTFADWVFSDASKCPSGRLAYELWHKMISNITDVPHDSDLEDFQHVGYLPYVDLMTLDRRMCGYVCQVSKSISINYNEKIFRNIKEILRQIQCPS